MQLPKESRQRLATEYRYAADRMKESRDPVRSLWYFSVFYGEANRVLNVTWDRDLVLLHNVLNTTYQMVIGGTQVQSMMPGAYTPPRVRQLLFEALTHAADDLANYIARPEEESAPEELRQLLGRFSEIGFAATGNGTYLVEKGLIKL